MRDPISIFIEFGQLVLELLGGEALKCGGIRSLSHAVKDVVVIIFIGRIFEILFQF